MDAENFYYKLRMFCEDQGVAINDEADEKLAEAAEFLAADERNANP